MKFKSHILGFNFRTIAYALIVFVFITCSTNDPVDPPIMGKWILTQYRTSRPFDMQWINAMEPRPCERATTIYFSNNGLMTYINTSSTCAFNGNGYNWKISSDSLICTDLLGATVFPSGKILTLNSSEIKIGRYWSGDTTIYKKIN